MENGLETASKTFSKEIDKIYLLEFIDNDEKLLIIGIKEDEKVLKIITWDLYNTGKVEEVETLVLDDFLTIENLGTRLARTSGNLLRVDNKGNVTSVLKKIENTLNQKKSKETSERLKKYSDSDNLPSGEIHRKEPWVTDKDYERKSYRLYHDDKRTLQLIV